MDRVAWPAEKLAHELRTANTLALRDAPEDFLRGRDSWPNQQRERFDEECVEAAALGIKPVQFGTPGFDALLTSGVRFNWAVRLDGTFWISASAVTTDDGPVRISHALLAENGGAVLAAGEAKAGVYLSNTSGHYKNGEHVIDPVKSAFASVGIFFSR